MREYALDKAVDARRSAAADWLVLTKPGIVGLVLVSALAGLYLGERGVVSDLPLMVWTLVGVGLSTAGSAVLNNYIDRDIDPLMERTKTRALAAGTIAPASALAFGLLLVAASMAILLVAVNPLTAALTATAVVFYVVFYGMWLKRTTPLANQVGCVAGALPPVLGYTAATGVVNLEAAALFAIVTLWQQPHALSLSLKYREDYARAGVPVVAVALGVDATKRKIAWYTALLVPASLSPWLLGMAGTWYLAIAVAMGAYYLFLSGRFLASTRDKDMFLFFYSIIYLTAVFAALVVDMRVV